ncbi:hypothetical protein HYY74_01470 [Candidatus Woesearchaeota archaeon]|nr:hypothetical protein [Candidatus Woesearchaeota archaeon]
MSPKRILFTRPEHDKVTFYLSCWAHELLVQAKNKGHHIIDVGAEKAIKSVLEEYLIKSNPRLVLLNGHGNREAVGGHKDELLIIKAQNDHLLAGKIIYALSCHSAAELGPSAVASGATAFIGYNAPFCFLTDKNRECTPDNDPLANIFKEASNQIGLSLIKGKTVQSAYQTSQNKFQQLIRKHGSSDSTPEAKEIRFWLFWDMKSQVAHGEQGATL